MPKIQDDKVSDKSLVQSVLFDTKKWTVSDAKEWLKGNSFLKFSVDTGEDASYYHFNQYNKENFKSFKTINAGESSLGVKLIIGFTKMKKANEGIIDLNAIFEFMTKLGYTEDVYNVVTYIIENIDMKSFRDIMKVLDKVLWEIDSKLFDETKNIIFTKSKDDKKLLKKMSVKLFKESANQEKRLIYGVVIEPKSVDTDKEWTDEPEIESACHTYMKYFKEVGIEHEKVLPTGLTLVENYINPANFIANGVLIKKGSWVMVHFVEDEEVWNDVKEGKLTGYSFEGLGFLSPQKPV